MLYKPQSAGDEFRVLVIANSSKIESLVTKLFASLNEVFVYQANGQSYLMPASIGVAQAELVTVNTKFIFFELLTALINKTEKDQRAVKYQRLTARLDNFLLENQNLSISQLMKAMADTYGSVRLTPEVLLKLLEYLEEEIRKEI